MSGFIAYMPIGRIGRYWGDEKPKIYGTWRTHWIDCYYRK